MQRRQAVHHLSGPLEGVAAGVVQQAAEVGELALELFELCRHLLKLEQKLGDLLDVLRLRPRIADDIADAEQGEGGSRRDGEDAGGRENDSGMTVLMQ